MHIKKPSKLVLLRTIERNSGQISKICKALNITPHTFYKWKDDDLEVEAALVYARESLLDLAEDKLTQNVKSDNENVSQRAVEFVLRYLGKKRGYSERKVIEASTENKNINLNWTVDG